MNIFNRRGFLKGLSFGVTATGLSKVAHSKNSSIATSEPVSTQLVQRSTLPRQVWIATLSQYKLRAATEKKMLEVVLREMQSTLSHSPDIICLPEFFVSANIDTPQLTPRQAAESFSEDIKKKISKFAKKNKCYVICPMHTLEKNKLYNAAVVFNRQGENIGEYRKMHPTPEELEQGIQPGPKTPSIFKADFATFGIQICFDIRWEDGWNSLRQQGAEIIFWPSAYAGGKVINAKAWQHQCVIVTSSHKNTSKICDITGEDLVSTHFWQPTWAIGMVQLEKAYFDVWPHILHVKAIQAEYGKKIKITIFDEEEWGFMESLSPEVKIADVFQKYGLPSKEMVTVEQHARLSQICE